MRDVLRTIIFIEKCLIFFCFFRFETNQGRFGLRLKSELFFILRRKRRKSSAIFYKQTQTNCCADLQMICCFLLVVFLLIKVCSNSFGFVFGCCVCQRYRIILLVSVGFVNRECLGFKFFSL